MQASVKDRTQKLSNIIMHFYEHEKINNKRMELSKECAEGITQCIAAKYPYLDLEPYGSIISGFGSKDSDADFSLTVRKRSMAFVQDTQVLEDIKTLVSKAQPSYAVEYVPARIPLVKLMWKGLEVDISFNNQSAIDNTELLQTYCKWDERLPALGFWVKKWAKAFGMCSKRDGTLSSYIYILMCIHYLQRCNPRVLPCLHSEFGGYGARYSKGVQSRWSQNTENAAQLFLGFLDYYCKFSFAQKKIQIHDRSDQWNHGCNPMVIMDPLENCNVTEYVKQDKLALIQDVFRRSAKDVKEWIEGRSMTEPIMKQLFNVQ